MPVLRSLQQHASATCNVERNRHDITDVDELDVTSGLNHLTRNFVPENEPVRSGCPAPHHVLVAAANIRRNDLENRAVLALTVAKGQFRKVDGLHLDVTCPHVGDTSIRSHNSFPPPEILK